MADTKKQPQPGTVIAPGGTTSPAEPATSTPTDSEAPATPNPAPTEPPAEQTATPVTTSDTPSVGTASGPEAGQATQPETAANQAGVTEDQYGQKITWTASEFVAHHKSAGWYLMIIICSVLLAGLAFLLTRDLVSTTVVIIAGLLLAVYGSHQPRQLQYEVNEQGIGIGGKYYPYENFRSFAIAPEGAFSGLVFMPLRRFAVPITIYYDPADEEKILAMLDERLPLEEHRIDAIDYLIKRLRF